MFGERYLQPPRAESTKRENHSISSARGPDRSSPPALGAERRCLLSAGRERRRGRDADIHPSIQGTSTAAHCAHTEACRSQPPCFPRQSQPSPASFPTQLLSYSPKAKLSEASSAHREVLPPGKEYEAFFQRTDPVFNVTQLCKVHTDDTGCALLAVRLMFGNKKTDGFICLIIWCCQERP